MCFVRLASSFCADMMNTLNRRKVSVRVFNMVNLASMSPSGSSGDSERGSE